jgi:hypothetical protein
MTSPWEDGAKVQFTDSARVVFERGHEADSQWAQSTSSPQGVYTVRNTTDGLHDVFFVENGERWGVSWLRAIDQDVRDAHALLTQGRSILNRLKEAEQSRMGMSEALEAANAANASDGRDPHAMSTYDILGRLLHSPLRADIMRWEGECIARAEGWLRIKTAFDRVWPNFADHQGEHHHGK